MTQSCIRRRAAFTFDNIKARCRFSHHSHYSRYGGRGIELKISREDFIVWYIRETKGRTDLTIDCVDNDGHYELGNMQLITISENSRKAHQESNAMQKSRMANIQKGIESCSVGVLIGGIIYPSLSEASRRLGFNPHYVSVRINRHGSLMPNGDKIHPQ